MEAAARKPTLTTGPDSPASCKSIAKCHVSVCGIAVARDKTGMQRRRVTSDHRVGHTLVRLLQEIPGGLDELRTEERRHVFAEPFAIISFAIQPQRAFKLAGRANLG
jgi:hypothetical protein